MLRLDLAPALPIQRPYPGLRPFEVNEGLLFYGRQEHTRGLLERLSRERFLAVIGSSGTGKSSLVRAGLLPALFRGYLAGASSQWRIAVMRPGNAPLEELANALSQSHALGLDALRIHEILTSTTLGLVNVVRQGNLLPGENVLLVVDQFEELFRFEHERLSEDQGAEAGHFVQLLLEATGAYSDRIYVVITMRSDFLGNCTLFTGLPEVLNRCQYLIPHLNRLQRQQAIEQPPQLAGVHLKPALVQRLLNDLGEDPLRLPVLQHALMRTFESIKDGCREIDFNHYENSGKIDGALDKHAEEIVAGLSEEAKAWVEKLFRSLTTVESGRAIRRPARLARIYEVLEVTDDVKAQAAVREVILAFTHQDSCLLISSTGTDLASDSVIDISHESLISGWNSLKTWLEVEARSAALLRSLADSTQRQLLGEGGFWRDPDLRLATLVKIREGWNGAWARQYLAQNDATFEEIETFLKLSEKQREQEKREARNRKLRIILGAVVAAGLFAGAAYAGYNLWHTEVHKVRAGLTAKLQIESKQRSEIESLLKIAEAKLQRNPQSSEEQRLQAEIADLKARLEVSAKSEDSTETPRAQSQRPTPGIPIEDSDTPAVLGNANSLEEQLRISAAEENRLRSRVEELEAKLERRAHQPLFINVHANTLATLDVSQNSDQIQLFARDVSFNSNTARLFVLTRDGSAANSTDFSEDSREARQMERKLLEQTPCPGHSKSDELGNVWCFEVDRREKKPIPREFGSFKLRDTTYTVMLTGWTIALGGTRTQLTIAVYPNSLE
jgi:hypothetical protein